MSFTYGNFGIDEDALKDIRHALYHSSGDGYVVLRRFIEPQIANHMRSVWGSVEPWYKHVKLEGYDNLRIGDPNLERYNPGFNRAFENFFWNEPLDDITMTVSMYIAVLRNRVEGRAPLFQLYPQLDARKPQRVVSYRVLVGWNQDVGAPPHRDWLEPDTYDLARLQATLMLSERGVDYDGDGFVFETNAGRRIVIGRDVAIAPGDLVLWRYNNQHAILNLKAADGQLGFMRIIHPPHLFGAVPEAAKGADNRYAISPQYVPKQGSWKGGPVPLPASEAPAAQTAVAMAAGVAAPGLRERLRDTAIGRRLLVPVWRALRGRLPR